MKRTSIQTALAAVVVLGGWAESALACSTCFGDPDSDLVIGAKAGVAVMAVVAYSVLGTVAWIGRGWYIRAKALQSEQLSDDQSDSRRD